MSEQWLSIVEYARTYNVSDMTIRRRIKTGKLHAILREGKYYIPVREEGVSKTKPPMPAPVSKSASTEPVLMKAHPTPARSYHEVSHAHIPAPVTKPNPEKPGIVPTQVRAQIQQAPTTLVETGPLLSFCESALKKLTESEARLESGYKSKVLQLEAQLKTKDLEISHLYQQLEDLQVLVKILEKK
jgi:hypothetical protein